LEEDKEEERILNDISSSLKLFEKKKSNLIPLLQMIQKRHGYIPRRGMVLLAEYLDLSPSHVYGVATFYNQFRFNPPGRHPIKVCLGTACHVKGGEIILENFERKLGIKSGETTKDREFSLDRVACVGCCALAPVAIIDDKVQGYMMPSKVEGILLGFEIEKEKKKREKDKDDTE